MKDIAYRLRQIREVSGLSRKEVEQISLGVLKASSLSTFENNQSKISIHYLANLVQFYRNQSVNVSFDWVVNGEGITPSKQNNMLRNLSAVNEANFFRESHSNSIILSSDTYFPPYINVGDFVGAVKNDDDKDKTKIRVIKIKDKGFSILEGSFFDDFFIYRTGDGELINLPSSNVLESYDIIWIRKNL
ncbi:helix-turn-helix transcriptional regulator [Vibrio sp.]|uniref:helix-turn-helix domain-containing protein n=1 Tax=Vibrio sp. TaxID=678 RepID=UPI00311DCE9B